MPPTPRKHIPAILPYPPGKPIEEVQREFGLTEVIKLASNENPLGPSRKAVVAMRALAAEMHLYPDGAGFYLKGKLSEKYGLPPEWIVLGNGSDEINGLLIQTYVNRDESVIFSEHDFVSYLLEALKANVKFKQAPLRDWRVDVDALLERVDSKTKLICIANPTNPIGTMIEKKEFERFLAEVSEDVLVLLDEAYFEYVTKRSYPDGLKFVRRHPNLVVARTFSKAYGLAGLRVGYAFANPEIIQNLDRVRKPFNVNRMAQASAIAALDDEAHIRRSRENNEKGRQLLESELRKMKIAFVPSVTNFILIDTGRSGADVTRALMAQGVIVRPMAGYGLPQHIRVTIGRPAENRKFLAVLKKVIQ
ncbi:histidinol-phosphate transaminase [bacterium]|nr:histidinol-phosphate transaminase [bacterium]